MELNFHEFVLIFAFVFICGSSITEAGSRKHQDFHSIIRGKEKIHVLVTYVGLNMRMGVRWGRGRGGGLANN